MDWGHFQNCNMALREPYRRLSHMLPGRFNIRNHFVNHNFIVICLDMMHDTADVQIHPYAKWRNPPRGLICWLERKRVFNA